MAQLFYQMILILPTPGYEFWAVNFLHRGLGSTFREAQTLRAETLLLTGNTVSLSHITVVPGSNYEREEKDGKVFKIWNLFV